MNYTSNMFNEISTLKDGTLDLSTMNFIDAAKTVIMVSAYNSCSAQKETVKCKVSSDKMEKFISDLPTSKSVKLTY